MSFRVGNIASFFVIILEDCDMLPELALSGSGLFLLFTMHNQSIKWYSSAAIFHACAVPKPLFLFTDITVSVVSVVGCIAPSSGLGLLTNHSGFPSKKVKSISLGSSLGFSPLTNHLFFETNSNESNKMPAWRRFGVAAV